MSAWPKASALSNAHSGDKSNRKERIVMPSSVQRLVMFGVEALFPSLLYAQASITGTARHHSGAVLPDVTVEASSPALIEKARSAVSDGADHNINGDLRA